MVKRHVKFFTMAIILCVLIVITAITIVLNVVNKSNIESNSYILTLVEAIKIMKEKFDKVFDCVEKKSCDLYTIDVVIIATPTHSGLYDVSIYVNGLNYTRGSTYRDTIVWRAVLNKLSYHISMINYGVLRGYEEWLNVEKRLGTHIDVGYGIYNESRGTLSIHIDLPTFKFCEIAHACGQFYLNATLYIDNEKYIIYQYTKLNFNYLIDKDYIKIREIKNGYAYPINPPAVIRFTYIETPFWRIPIDFVEKNTGLPIVVALHMVTTNHSILEKYLTQLKTLRPLIEASLMKSYIDEIARDNLTKYIKLSNQVNSKAIQEFLMYLQNKVVEKLYPGTQMEIKYINNSHGADYYLAKWNNTKLIARIGALEISIHDASRRFVKMLIDTIINIH